MVSSLNLNIRRGGKKGEKKRYFKIFEQEWCFYDENGSSHVDF
jgi:hypothetical protein